MKGVILYGPPASGKTTVAEALERLDSRYVSFRRLKAGGGRTNGYRMTTLEEIDALDARGDIIWRNDRYNATYAVDLSSLVGHLAVGVPVLQLGQPAAVAAVLGATPAAGWLVIELFCPRHIALKRMRARRDDDLEARLAAWDDTTSLNGASASFDTATVSTDDIAAHLHGMVLG